MNIREGNSLAQVIRFVLVGTEMLIFGDLFAAMPVKNFKKEIELGRVFKQVC